MEPIAKSQLDLRRVLLAFALTPLLTAFYCAVWLAQPWALSFGLLIAYPSAALIGTPLLFVLWRRGWLKGGYFAVAGTLCALPAIGLDASPFRPPQFESLDAANALYLLLAGGFSGTVFWLLGIAGDSPLRWRSLFDLGPPG